MEWLIIFGLISFVTAFNLWYSIRNHPAESELRPISYTDFTHRWGNDRYGHYNR